MTSGRTKLRWWWPFPQRRGDHQDEASAGLDNNGNRYSQVSFLLAIGSSSIAIWWTFPLISISSKCLLTSLDECTRWGPMKGGNFHYPVTVATLNLFLVSGFLVLVVQPFVHKVMAIQSVLSLSSSSSPHTLARCGFCGNFFTPSDSEGGCFGCDRTMWPGHVTRPVEGDELTTLSTTATLLPSHGSCNIDDTDVGRTMRMILQPRLKDKLGSCLWLGIAFGSKYVVAHWALSVTPILIYELLHCLNIVIVVICSYVILGEKIQSIYQVVGCLGIVVGSVITTSTKLIELIGNIVNTSQHDNKESSSSSSATLRSMLMMLIINVLNGILAGLCVVLLRKTMLSRICESSIQVSFPFVRRLMNRSQPCYCVAGTITALLLH
jgi:hypothetical protein